MLNWSMCVDAGHLDGKRGRGTLAPRQGQHWRGSPPVYKVLLAFNFLILCEQYARALSGQCIKRVQQGSEEGWEMLWVHPTRTILEVGQPDAERAVGVGGELKKQSYVHEFCPTP